MDRSKRTASTALGADVGASLTKLARLAPDGRIDFTLLPRDAIERVAAEVESSRPGHVGLTGGGAPQLSRLLSMDTARVDEFDAWRRGSLLLLRQSQLEPKEGQPYLLVSLGTGTSVLCVSEGKATRVGGTALGGGTVVGLGAGLAGARSFGEVVELARRGDRRRVDLLVREVGDVPLPGDVTAASFAKLAREDGSRAPEDLAHAVMGLVGENVALVCNALAVAHGVRRIVYAGSTLRDNPALSDILRGITRILGQEPVFLPNGEFTGALGALVAARETAGEETELQLPESTDATTG